MSDQLPGAEPPEPQNGVPEEREESALTTPGSFAEEAHGSMEGVPEPPIVAPPSGPAPMTPPPPGEFGAIPPMSAPTEFASNYPRSGLNILGYIRPPGVYWDTISIAFSMVTSNVGVYVVSTLLMCVMIGAVYGVTFPFIVGSALAGAAAAPGAISGGAGLAIIIPQAIVQFCGVFLSFCLVSVGVRHAQGNFPQISDFFIPFKKFKTAALASALVSAPLIVISVLSGILQFLGRSNPAVVVGVSFLVLLLLIPVYIGFYGPLMLSGTASIFNGQSPMDMARKVYSQLGWQSLMFGLLVVVTGLITFLGLFAFCVGILFTCPIFTNVIALHYIYNFPEDQTPLQNTVPSAG